MEGMPTSRLTPHRVALCILVQLYVRPRQLSYSHLPSGVRQQLALFLLHDLKGCENFSEPSLEELRDRLQQEIPGGGEALSQQLLSRLFSFNCPDDLFTFFLGGQGGLRDLLMPVSPNASPDTDDERLHVDLTSTLGQFLRRSLLDFNALSFEGACRLLNDVEAYRHNVAEERGKVLQPSTGLARRGIADIEFEDFEEGDEGEDDEYDDVLGDENEDDPDGIGDGNELEGEGVEDVDPWEDDDTEDEFAIRRESFPFMDEGRQIGRGYGLSHLAIGAARNRWRAGAAGGRSERSGGGNMTTKPGLRKGGSSWGGSEGGGSRRGSGKPPVMDGGFSFAFGKGTCGGGYGEAESPRKVSVFPRTLAQLDSYLREKAVFIEKEIGRVPMTTLDEQLDELERLSPEMPKIHYLRYLNCLHHGDYPGAMDSLHRYFDYSAGQGGSILGTGGGGMGGGPGGGVGGAAGGGPGGGPGPGVGPQGVNDNSVGRFQAALLSLGSMHVQFGHIREALQALNETVRIAQQNNDDVCLAHALGSLCHLLSNAVGLPDVSGAIGGGGGGGGGMESSPRVQIQEQQQQELLIFQLLKQCLRRARELRLPHLVAFSRLALAKFHMTHVHRLPPIGSQRPAASGGLGSYPIDVCKYLRLSALHYDVLGVSTLMPAPAGPGVGLRGLHMPGGDMYGRPPQMGTSLSIPGAPGGGSTSAAESAMAAAAAAAAGSGGRLGPVAGSVAKLAGTAHLLRAASWEIYGSAPSARASTLIHACCYGDVASADDSCLAYVKLATHIAARKGFAAAMASIRVAMRRFPLPANRRLRVMQLSLIHDQALNRGEMKLAEVASAQLEALASPVDGVDMELKIEAGIRRARTLLATERTDQAAEVAYDLFSRCYQTGLQIECPKVLLLFAEIYKAAGNVVVGLFYALACISQCQSFNMDVIWAAATVVLAELWLMLGASHAPQALTHLHKVLPVVLGHGGLELCGRTHLLIFKCQTHILTKDQLMANPDSLLEPLGSAVEAFEAIEAYSLAAEVYYFQAIVYNNVNKTDQRDEAAKNFQRCTLAYSRNRRSLKAVLPD